MKTASSNPSGSVREWLLPVLTSAAGTTTATISIPRITSTVLFPGHSFGQYVSGLARAYAITGSKPTQAKVQRLVRAYAETVEPTGKFYVDYRLPGYTFDKTCCGLIDAHEFAGDPIALDVLKRSTDAVLPHLPEKALSRVEQEARPHKSIAFTWDETYTLSENLFLAYGAAVTNAIWNWPSASFTTSTTMRLPETTTPCPVNTLIAT